MSVEAYSGSDDEGSGRRGDLECQVAWGTRDSGQQSLVMLTLRRRERRGGAALS